MNNDLKLHPFLAEAQARQAEIQVAIDFENKRRVTNLLTLLAREQEHSRNLRAKLDECERELRDGQKRS